jgi:hypothetical protein
MPTLDEQIDKIEQSIPDVEQRLSKEYEKFLQHQQKLAEVKALLQRYRMVKEVGDMRDKLEKQQKINAHIQAALDAKKAGKSEREDNWFRVKPGPIPGKCIIEWERPPSIFPDGYDDNIDWKPADVKGKGENEGKCSDCGVDHHHDHDIN